MVVSYRQECNELNLDSFLGVSTTLEGRNSRRDGRGARLLGHSEGMIPSISVLRRRTTKLYYYPSLPKKMLQSSSWSLQDFVKDAS